MRLNFKVGVLALVAVLTVTVSSLTLYAAVIDPEIKYRLLREKPRGNEVAPDLFMTLSGELTDSYFDNTNIETDGVEDESEVRTTLRGSVGLTWQPNPNLRFRGDLQAVFNDNFPELGGANSSQELRLRDFYVGMFDVAPGFDVFFGRTDFEDEREWIWDRRLDGIRAFWRSGEWGVEAAAVQEEVLPRTLLPYESPDKEPLNLYLHLRKNLSDDIEGGMYFLNRSMGGIDGLDMSWFGANAEGEISDQTNFWIQTAYLDGRDEDGDVYGYAFDVGSTHVFDAKYSPSLTLGLAVASGSTDGGPGTFRQTGLQDNSAKFNGETSLAYYGEVFDPELSNMVITTVGFGIRPSDNSSVDLVWHRYLQKDASSQIGDIGLSGDPNGKSRDLGQGLDLVFGIETDSGWTYEGKIGVFKPGAAFSAQDTPFGMGFKISRNF